MENIDDDTVNPSVHTMSIPKDILEGLCSRFLINIPVEEKEDMIRLCFQIELAHWFYLDFYRQEDPQLPGYGLQQFMEIMLREFTFLNKDGMHFQDIFSNWKKYKFEVPVYGAIMLDEMLENCILVRGCHKRISWGFPKGKVNKDEDGKDCAIREVYEETGYDIKSLIDEHDYLEVNVHDHKVRLYIVPCVESSFAFEPRTRGEIQEIKWFPIDALPSHKKDTVSRDRLNLNASSFFMVQPFVKSLRKWVNQKKQTIQDFAMVQAPFLADVKRSQRSAFTIVGSAKEEEERLLRRKQEEEKRFQETQLNSHPLLGLSMIGEQWASPISQKTKTKKKSDKGRSCDGQPEAIRKLLTGTVDVTQVDQTAQQPRRGFGVPPGYVGRKKQPESGMYKDWANGRENESNVKKVITRQLDEVESRKHWEHIHVQEQRVMTRIDHVQKVNVSENGIYFGSHAGRVMSHDYARSRGWYGGTPNDLTEEKKTLSNLDETFQFAIPEFLNFKFDTEALLATLPRRTMLPS